MQLIQILLVVVSLTVLLSGLSVIFGSAKSERANAVRFFMATLGAALWTLAILTFFNLPVGAAEIAPIMVVCIIGGITLCDVALLAYLGWNYKGGKAATALFALGGIALVAILAIQPEVFYTHISLESEYNTITVTKGWYFGVLIAYFFLISITFSSYLQKRIKNTTNRGMKTGLKVFYAGLSIGGILALIFNLILISARPELTWIGPMATSISILSFYYSVVRYKTISLSSTWMRMMSYAILIATGVIIYMLVFYAVFTALFKIPNPSPAVLTLNIIMSVILVLIMPAITEIVSYMRTMIAVDNVDLSYIIRKMEKVSKKTFDRKEATRFLADSMHYSYIMLIVNGHVYSSDNIKMDINEVSKIAKAKHKDGVAWIMPEEIGSENLAREYDVSRIGILTDKTGHEIGKIVFGKKLSRIELSRRDLVKYEAIVNLLSTFIEESKK